jgi:hypothetical protein
LGVVPVAYYPNAEINKQKIIKENSGAPARRVQPPAASGLLFFVLIK